MGITAAVIQQKEFTTRFRGFDVQEVDNFLDEVGKEVEVLKATVNEFKNENHQLDLENKGYKTREDSMKKVMLQSQEVLEQMKNNAKKSAEAIVANAEVEAEKILNRAHQRLSQLYSDITELKRQRMQIEVQISSVIESHSKLLDMGKEENKVTDEIDSSLRFIKQG